jgi:hypothetical protein
MGIVEIDTNQIVTELAFDFINVTNEDKTTKVIKMDFFNKNNGLIAIFLLNDEEIKQFMDALTNARKRLSDAEAIDVEVN